MRTALGQTKQRLVIAGTIVVCLLGVIAWVWMPRQEDPALFPRYGIATIGFPGADAEMVERLVVDPIEDELANVVQLKHLRSRATADYAVFVFEFHAHVLDVDGTWSDIDDALERASHQLPEGVLEPEINRDLADQDLVVLAVTGSHDLVELRRAARRVQRKIRNLEQLKQVHLIGDPGEQVTIEVDEHALKRVGLTLAELRGQLARRDLTPAGGLLRVAGKQVRLRPGSEFDSIESIRQTPIMTPSGASLRLDDLATISLGPTDPSLERMRVDGQPAVGIGVVADDAIDVVRFGERVREVAQRAQAELAPLRVHELNYQPHYVVQRLEGLSTSLLLSITILAVILVLSMGVRLGVVVIASVPMTALAALGIYAVGGGVLHQMSVAALIISLGILVDNSIAMAELVQAYVDEGLPARQAAERAVAELWVPLATSTGTTIAAFLPMLFAVSSSADYARPLPIVMIVTLTMSYGFATLVVPRMAERLLRPRVVRPHSPVWRRMVELFIAHPWPVLGFGMACIVAAGVGALSVEQQFFPLSDRPLVVVDLDVAEGAQLGAIDDRARAFEAALRERPEVVSVTSYVGRGMPRIYYNLFIKPVLRHHAELVIETTGLEANASLMEWVRREGHDVVPGTILGVRTLDQGPPVLAPIDIRLQGENPDDMVEAAQTVLRTIKTMPSVVDARHNADLGAPSVDFDIDDEVAAMHGISPAEITTAIRGHTVGLVVGDLRSADDPIPIIVRGQTDSERPVERLLDVPLRGVQGWLPLRAVAEPVPVVAPSARRHLDGRPLIAIQARTQAGHTTFAAVGELKRDLAKNGGIPESVTLRFFGEVRGQNESAMGMLRTLPIGLAVMLVCLLFEFPSFRRILVIGITVPLATTGIVPGLLIGQQPFGFMALLGVSSLVGIVLNDAIVLLDVVERERKDGAPIPDALERGVMQRTRPILLTTVTTIAGLFPLAISSSTLWPPLAWAMMTGLLASTLFTLAVVPAMYRVVVR